MAIKAAGDGVEDPAGARAVGRAYPEVGAEATGRVAKDQAGAGADAPTERVARAWAAPRKDERPASESGPPAATAESVPRASRV